MSAFLLIIESLTLLLCVIILLKLLYLIICQKEHKKKHHDASSIREISTTIIILSICAILFYCVALTSLLIGDINIDSVYFIGRPYGIMSIFWATANSLVYFIFMCRIRNLFSETVHAPATITYMIISILVLTYFACEFTFFMFEITKTTDKIEFAIIIVEAMADLFAAISLTLVFVKTLRNVTLQNFMFSESTIGAGNNFQLSLLDDVNNDEFDVGSVHEHLEQNTEQKILLTLITRQTVLAITGTAATQIWLLYYVYLEFVWLNGSSDNDDKLYILHVISDSLAAMDCFINALCIFLTFIFTKSYYYTLCGLCHKQCNKCFKKSISHDIKIKYRKRQSE
eukprot:364313_1